MPKPSAPQSVAALLLLFAAVAVTAFTAFAAAPPPNLERALDAQQALALERPGDPQVFNDLGNLLLLADRAAEAEEAYRRALELAPEAATVRYNLALLLQNQGDLGEALDELQEVVELEPSNAWAYYQMGVIHQARQRRSSAIDAYAQAFRLDPDLAFPEVNPQVIDNPYLTASMLKAYQELPDQAAAPNDYAQPSRIANLLVAYPSQADTPDEAEQVLEDAEMAAEDRVEPGQPEPQPGALDGVVGETRRNPTAGGARQGQPRGAFPVRMDGEEEGEEEPPAGRVLRREDLERSPGLNQASPDSPSGRTYVPGGQRDQPTRTWSRPTPSNPGGIAPPAGSVRPQDDPRRATPPNPSYPPPVRYRPGTQSSGRLELQLSPLSPGVPRTRADGFGR